MIVRALQNAGRFLTSARLATLLLAFVGLWAILASLVPQGEPSAPAVAEWASAHPFAETVVQAVGLHHAFTAPLFVLCVFVLAVCTALCAWQRTQVAIERAGIIRVAAALDPQAPAAGHDLEIVCDPALCRSAILTTTAETLGRLGIKTKQGGGGITATSSPWFVWGSPVFHWALLVVIVMVPLGSLARSSGQIGLAVGQSKPDQPASYGLLSSGPLRSWDGVERTIRVDAFEVNYKTGGVNRGPTPTVSVLNANGEVVKSQRVYPNGTLKLDSLTIYPLDYGLSATVSIADASGAEVQRSTELLDFSGKAEGGTAPISPLVLKDATGVSRFNVLISVPLDRAHGGYLGRLPEVPSARVLVASLDGQTLLDESLRPGEDLLLPTGGMLRLRDVGYYARLQLVDDPSIPFLYFSGFVAMLGLGLATLGRQMIVSARVVETPAGLRLAVGMRLWRNVTTSRSEIEAELRQALGAVEKGNVQ